MYRASEIATIVNGRLVGSDNSVKNIIFDSRMVHKKKDRLFVALKGGITDGHNYIDKLIDSGVKSFIISEEYAANMSSVVDGISYIVTTNPLRALQKMAAHHRKSINYPVVAVTGSNGKSIVKEWTHQLFSDMELYRSPKSYNSQLGVALSLLLMPKEGDISIIEAGISEMQEMQHLQEMIAPNIVIVTNIGEAHGENFVSKEAKLHEKLILAKDSDIIITSEKVAKMIGDGVGRERLFIWGEGDECDMQIVSTDRGAIEFRYNSVDYLAITPFTDSASYQNIIQILSLAAYLKLDLQLICSRTELLTPVPMRLEIVEGYGSTVIINDCYNSDYNSLSVALSHLASLSVEGGRAVILSDIIGSMKSDNELYEEVAQLLNSCNVNKIIAIGEKIGYCLKDKITGTLSSYTTTEEFLNNLTSNTFYNTTLLIKGCRKFGFERIVERLQYKQHKSVIEVNLDALVYNCRYYRSLLPNGTKMVAMVKAMGYGSGYYEVALALQNIGVEYLAVAYIDEGVILRERGITLPIIILNSNPYDYPKMIEYRLEPEIYNSRSLNLFIAHCRGAGVENYPIHIKLDSGMHRMGFEPSDINNLKTELMNSSEVSVASIFSHLSSSDDPTLDEETHRQIELFNDMCREINLPHAPKHIANSCGAMRFESARLDMVRIGLGLYGISPFKQNDLKNVMSLHTHILQIKKIEKGDYVGYNMNEIVDKPTVIATLSIGYADGLDRRLGCGKWNVEVNGQKAKTVGNISMDTCAIDITGIEANEGDRVTIYSTSDDIKLMAELLNTIPYEILTSTSTRIKRIYTRE